MAWELCYDSVLLVGCAVHRVTSLGHTPLPLYPLFSLDTLPEFWYNKNMEKRQHRTPEEIIEETEAKLERLRLRQAKATAKSHPSVAPVLEELNTVNKSIREAQRGLGTGPQSFDARIAKHTAWIEKIEAARSEAIEMLELSSDQKTDLDAQLASLLSEIVADSQE